MIIAKLDILTYRCKLFKLTFAGIQSFNYLGLGYRVDWPVNIILTSGALEIYAEIFSFLIQVKLALSSLAEAWCSLKVYAFWNFLCKSMLKFCIDNDKRLLLYIYLSKWDGCSLRFYYISLTLVQLCVPASYTFFLFRHFVLFIILKRSIIYIHPFCTYCKYFFVALYYFYYFKFIHIENNLLVSFGVTKHFY